uniref:Uncharacterized protein n=1 Tax=Mycolicibacterium neoaurum VKM Ac-1815D TaxID=700508 RepID=V5XJQ1_MYCNE
MAQTRPWRVDNPRRFGIGAAIGRWRRRVILSDIRLGVPQQG